MNKYLYFWIFFIVISAILHGYENYKELKKTGYSKNHFKNSKQIIEFDGRFKETFSCTLASTLGLIVSPVFLAIETLKFIPAAIVLYFIS